MEQNEQSKKLIKLSIHFDGDWDKMYESISKRENVDYSNDCQDFKGDCITILDTDYPKYLSQGYKPPIVVFYDGDISLLKDYSDTLIVLNGNNTCAYATKSLLTIIKEADDISKVVILKNTFDLEGLNEIVATNKKIIMVLDKGIDYQDKYQDVINLVKSSGGLLITEIPHESPETAKRIYTMRLLSLLSRKILVGGVSKRDSLIHVVAIGLQQGSEVYCIPFQLGSNYINNSLIKDGAFLIEDASDLRR